MITCMLVIHILINGVWHTADSFIEGYKPSFYSSKEECLEVVTLATAIEIRRIERGEYKWIAPRIFSCHDMSARPMR